MSENIAVYAISADPPTWGHADIMMRASKKFDKLYWVVAINPAKKPMFTMDQKIEMMNYYIDYYKLKNVVIDSVEGATLKFANRVNAKFLIRGLRNTSDFQFEYELSVANRGIDKNVETICMFTKPHYATISSSIVRQLVFLDEKVTQYVHPKVERLMNSLK